MTTYTLIYQLNDKWKVVIRLTSVSAARMQTLFDK